MGPGGEVTRKRKEVLAVRVPRRRVIIRAESRKFVRFHGEFSYPRGGFLRDVKLRPLRLRDKLFRRCAR